MAKIPTPRTFRSKLWNRTPFWDSTIAIVAASYGFPSSYGHMRGGNYTFACLAFGGTAYILGASLRKAFIQWAEAEKKESGNELDGCLHTLRTTVLMDCSDPTAIGLRVTIHVPNRDSTEYVQMTDYVGDGRAGKTAGRSFGIHAGVVGRAFRLGQIALMERRTGSSYEDYVGQLIEEFGYTREQARLLDPSVQSAIAYPIVEVPGEQPIAVIYLDCKVPNFFADAGRRKILDAAMSGIAHFIGKRYT